MKGTFMHKRLAVAELEFDADGRIRRIGRVFAPEHLPVGTACRGGTVDRAALNAWWTDRSIPMSRSGIREALETLEIPDTTRLLLCCYGLSLSDQYWVCPEGCELSWEEVNYFDNPFSEDIGDVLFGGARNAEGLDFSSPDNTSDGNLKKRWRIIDGKRCLIKGGSNPFRQQPFNEVIAAEIMERLDIPHIPYRLVWHQGAPYSVCEDFVSRDTELVPAWRIFQIQRKDNAVSVYRHFVNCCEALGLRDVIPFLDRMIVLDYIIANEDRHLNNFGALRDAESLEWLGMAPVYDSGSSLGYDKLAVQIRSGRDVICKPFKRHHEEQLKLVSSFDWIEFQKLSDIGERMREILSSGDASDYIDETRREAIMDAVAERVRRLEQAALLHTPVQQLSVEDDVKENTAQAYEQGAETAGR